MSETLKKIEALEAEIKKLKDAELGKKQLELNKWYKSQIQDVITFITGDSNNYGVLSGEWSFDIYCSSVTEWVLATDKEVKDALVVEAKRQGFKEGVEINSFYDDLSPYSTSYKINTLDWYFNSSENSLQQVGDGLRLFCKGKWAEIIKDEPIKIGGYEVKKTEFNVYTIGCKSISKTALNSLRDVMIHNSFTKVSFDGVETDLETINKILSL